MKARSCAIFAGIVLLCGTGLAERLVGKSAPAITIREWVTDNPPDIRHLAGRVYVLEFWATWCHSCVNSVAHLLELNDMYKDKGLEFIALSEDKSAGKVRRFIRDRKINYAVAIDNGTADWFGVRCYPTMVVVDHSGMVVWQGLPWSGEFEKAVSKTLERAPSSLLTGVDLGPFSHLRSPLFGGSGFAKAYRELQSWAEKENGTTKSAAARTIKRIIDSRIASRTRQADQIRAEDPEQALRIYADIVSRYDGVEVAGPAKSAYLEMQQAEQSRRVLLAN